MDNYTCKTCGFFSLNRNTYANHKCSEVLESKRIQKGNVRRLGQRKTEEIVEPKENVKTEDSPKNDKGEDNQEWTKESLVALNRKQLNPLAEKYGLKFKPADNNGVVEDAILDAQKDQGYKAL